MGRYEIVDLIGAGGMGEVYRARDVQLDRTVAIKTIGGTTLSDEEATRRLIGEARAAAAISHPNITQIYDVGEHDGLAYVVMEFVDGLSLEAKLAAGALPVDDIANIGRALAAALAEAHRRGVIHRDIKPANILITRTGQVKVLDFGLAKLIPTGAASDDGVASTGIVMGTAPYMSPEQALGERITPATDVFSAGVVLYRMVTGALPFPGATMFQIVNRVLTAEPAPIARADLPPELHAAIARAMDKNPATRLADGAALEDALSTVDTRVVARERKTAIAVLPFDDLSADGDDRYFSRGLTEEITAALSNIASLAVISRTATSRYKDADRDLRSIAADLKVRYLLVGSVRKAGSDLRITAELIDAATNSNAWAQTYKGTLQNVFEIQEEVARKIVDALMVQLTPNENVTLGKRATSDVEAFDLYLRGRHHVSIATKRDLDLALSLFKQAIARDEHYAAAHAGAAEAAAAYYEYYERDGSWLDAAIDSALKALVHDASLSEAYAALGLAYFNKGSLEDSRTACRKAIALDPDNWIGYWTLGRIHYVIGETDSAIKLLQRVIALNPDFYPGYFTLRMVCQASGREEVYRAYLPRLVEEVLPRYLSNNPADARARNSYGMELSIAGRVAEGRAQVEQALEQAPGDPMLLYATACYNAVFGDRDTAVSLLRSAIDAGFANFEYLAQDPDLQRIRDHPAYATIVKRHESAAAPQLA